MSRIRTSLHGRQLGIDHDNRLLAPEGIVLGRNGQQRTLGGPDTIEFWDDFTDNNDSSDWNINEGTDSATSATSNISAEGGVIRFTTGDAGTGIAADGIALTQSYLIWNAQNGGLALEARIRLNQITEAYAFLGFTDQVVSLEAPVESAGSANTVTTNAADAVGFMFDTRMTDDNWWLVGVDSDVDATHQDTGFAPVATTFEVLRVELNADGVAVFYRNGLQVGTAMTAACTPTIPLAPVVMVSKLSTATSITADMDYLHIKMNRAKP